MKKQTTNYDMFKLRKDNRDEIKEIRIAELVASIKERNLLEYRPILVNADMEVMDGQHRFLAAKQLGLPIWYDIQESLTPRDIIILNNAKNWGNADYMNFYIKNGYQEYIKLNSYMKKNNIGLKIALSITAGHGRGAIQKFRNGEYEFVDETLLTEIDECWNTIGYIKKLNGATLSGYTNTSKFWNALLKLVRHPEFESDRWYRNLVKLISHCSVKPNNKEYLMMIEKIYNYHHTRKLSLTNDFESSGEE